MATTIGVKIDDELRRLVRQAAEREGRSSHWLIKQAIVTTLERLDRGEPLLGPAPDPSSDEPFEEAPPAPQVPQPFVEFAQSVQPQSVLRAKITAAYRRPETECLPLLVAEATLPARVTEAANELAGRLVATLRARGQRGLVEGLIHEYSLSSQEGVALLCLAEALLRIPDRATRDALIRDKLSGGDWHSHIGHSPSLFVNAATWGLLVTGRLSATSSEAGLSATLTRLIGRGGEPLIRKAVDVAMRMMGEQFVTGQTIAEALANSRRLEARGFRYSYDMLGEGARTGRDAKRYYADYEQAIHAIGNAAGNRGIYEGPGISIKLSALHPRYGRAQRDRVMAELLPKVRALVLLARRYDIGINIDAEEADRLDLSLDLLEVLCFDPALAGWNGIGFVVQAYQKRARFVVDYIIDLARRSGHRVMVRLVKGAYWDSEIKRAQVDGLEGFPVFTRKLYTDVSYIACARKLLAAPDAVFPQFATHNAQTLATIHAMAGANYYAGQYEFQCLHGMGEPLYEEVVGKDKLNRPCRIYAPVGTHETLLAYLVRRLLENGANTSFVNRISDPSVPVDELVADPVETVRSQLPLGLPHPKIVLPRDIFEPERANSAGIDLTNEQQLASLSAALLSGADKPWRAAPLLADGVQAGLERNVRNPADLRDVVGRVVEATDVHVRAAVEHAQTAAPIWQATPPDARAACLMRAADLLEMRMPMLIGLIVREAGKSPANAISEVREAVDFLRYYAAQVRRHFSNDVHRPLGPIVCISPWNFPLAIFTGQVAAALAAGNPVLAKPAEETPLIAMQAIQILREAGVPEGAVQLLPGDGKVGAQLVANPAIRGVMFTGSTEVAHLIRRQISDRLCPNGKPIPLIAETGGQNAMIVDSSALPEQVIDDVLVSAFDSAGQRCSALRVLCLQEEIAEHVLTMLKGAMEELAIGNPDRLSTDVGPVITAQARDGVMQHIEAMRSHGRKVHAVPLDPACRTGHFVPPTLIEIGHVTELKREVFGPVLHVVRFRRGELDALIDDINATGYALTFAVHSRVDETIARVGERINAGNIYVNRNMIGAVVGSQPFGGHALSGTGPKAGGPLYLRRLVVASPAMFGAAVKHSAKPTTARKYVDWLTAQGHKREAKRCADYIERSLLGAAIEMPGPVGERNIYTLFAKGAVLCVPHSSTGLLLQVGAALATGNQALIAAPEEVRAVIADLPAALRTQVSVVDDRATAAFEVALFEGDSDALREFNRELAERSGPIVPVYGVASDALATGDEDYPLEWLLQEQAISTNTTAAGGNANLMTIG
ncbi:trifunctional transcriptional regulator/proline dehydrogenase/L-glutamate gamma-semialdehyde dehydrogenase [Bradyrhizobium sp. LHD-71]|uniref:trifunctional transcriptional regulator/proline dehydrogenase/L-glutamate gamma-semialdehyde dehydrogenase n=1 Tax=Bradyrhizobium sp. LHD-71 TaxID=3072141 RepID=UPI00280F6C53|nr:trifunctional transcriptional regulator/proline dehydrogenase/L-glutamate gamma-semialdehyde dehydrogenase [Bradyrhizobium sp. LHD-71]MDQ8731513.1 trifunctional transcriptional regulator/proline dehydrogenase/L-glutamate gamma-semialdehyde dehydrogenase [Bradyrhizobium sp. LHD-71]